jgi:hypothetical protein
MLLRIVKAGLGCARVQRAMPIRAGRRKACAGLEKLDAAWCFGAICFLTYRAVRLLRDAYAGVLGVSVRGALIMRNTASSGEGTMAGESKCICNISMFKKLTCTCAEDKFTCSSSKIGFVH